MNKDVQNKIDAASNEFTSVFPFILFNSQKIESAFADQIRKNSRLSIKVFGITLIICTLAVWIYPSSMMHKNCQITSIGCGFSTIDNYESNLYDLSQAISLLSEIALIGCNYINVLSNYTEEIFYVLGIIPFLSTIIWTYYVYIKGNKHAVELLLSGAVRPDTALQYKLWNDAVLQIQIIVLILFVDEFIMTRTYLSIYFHVVILVLYVGTRVLVANNFRDTITNEWIPIIIISQTIQALAITAFLIISYIGRLFSELSDRASFYELLKHNERLNELLNKTQTKGKYAHEDVQESLINSMKTTQLELQILLYESGKQNNFTLIKQDAILTNCINILSTADDLYGVDKTVMEQLDFAEVTIPTIKLDATITKNTSYLIGSRNKLIFFTNDLVCDVVIPSDLEEYTGRNAHQINLLEIKETTPNLFIKVGLVLLSPYLDYLNIGKNVVINYLYTIQSKYQNNPYHNYVHGAMVAHMSICMLHSVSLYSECDTITILSLIIAALGHDVGHPGRNNIYHTSTKSLLASYYQNYSILENYHAFLIFRLAHISDEANIFTNLQQTTYHTIRSLIIDFVLATDNSNHFQTISSFRVRRIRPDYNIATNVEDRISATKMCIKAADLGHAFVDWEQHYGWSIAVTQEFYMQGDEEKLLGIPLSAMCDRDQYRQFYQSQLGFLSYVVQPLAEELKAISKTDKFEQEFISRLNFNANKWQHLVDVEQVPDVKMFESSSFNSIPTAAEALFLQAIFAEDISAVLINPYKNKSVIKIMNKKGMAVIFNKNQVDIQTGKKIDETTAEIESKKVLDKSQSDVQQKTTQEKDKDNITDNIPEITVSKCSGTGFEEEDRATEIQPDDFEANDILDSHNIDETMIDDEGYEYEYVYKYIYDYDYDYDDSKYVGNDDIEIVEYHKYDSYQDDNMINDENITTIHDIDNNNYENYEYVVKSSQEDDADIYNDDKNYKKKE